MTKYDSVAPFLTVSTAGNDGNEGLDPDHWLHDYSDHVSDWSDNGAEPDDPTWSTFEGSTETTGQGKGIIGLLNWMEESGVNSQYLLLMNLGGDGRDVSPFFLNPKDASIMDGSEPHNFGLDTDPCLFYSPPRLAQWNIVFTHAQEKGILLNMFFGETEDGNTNWLDDGHPGGEQWGVKRKLYMKNMVAMFGHHLGVKWTLWEELPEGPGGSSISFADLDDMAHWVQGWDNVDWDVTRQEWIGHAISVHGPPNGTVNTGGFRTQYQAIINTVDDADWWLDATSMQIHEGHDNSGGTEDSFGRMTEEVAEDFTQGDQNGGASGSGERFVVMECDEQGPPGFGLQSDTSSVSNSPWREADHRRRMILFDLFFSGAAGVEWYCGYYSQDNTNGSIGPIEGGGDLTLENYKTRGELLAWSATLREFLVDTVDDNYDLFTFVADDLLVLNEHVDSLFGDAEVFYKEGEYYMVYYPATLDFGILPDAGTIKIHHPSGGSTVATANWYHAKTMKLIDGDEEVLGANNGVDITYLIAGPSVGTWDGSGGPGIHPGPDDDYVMIVRVK